MGRRIHISCGLCPAVVVLNPYSEHYAEWVRIFIQISAPFPDGGHGTANSKSDVDLCPTCKHKDITEHIGKFMEQQKKNVIGVASTEAEKLGDEEIH